MSSSATASANVPLQASVNQVPPKEHLFALSAASPARLEQARQALYDHLARHPDADLLQISRAISEHRSDEDTYTGVALCTDREDALQALKSPDRFLTGTLRPGSRRVAFLFPGLGEQYLQMSAELYLREPVFRQTVDACAEILEPLLELDVRELLRLSELRRCSTGDLDLRSMLRRPVASGEQAPSLNQTRYAQPALFVVEYALALLLRHWGVEPDAMLGYSIGEYVAATLAGVLTLHDALRLVALRAKLIQGLPEGSMLAVPESESAVVGLLGDRLSLAAVNGEALCVVAGPLDAIDQLQAELVHAQRPAVRLQTSHAFHSNMMQPIVRQFTDLVASLDLRRPRIPYVSNVTGTWITDAQAVSVAYWRDHLCQPVRFFDGLRELWRGSSRLLVEVGPGRGLSTLALHNAPRADSEMAALPTLPASYESTSDRATLFLSLAKLWVSGVAIDWPAVLGRSADVSAGRALRAELVGGAEPAESSRSAPPSDGANGAPSAQNGGWRKRPRLFTSHAAPRTDRERAVLALWQEALEIEGLGVDDNFFELGGHSLLAMLILNRLTSRHALRIPLSVFFEQPTIRQFCTACDAPDARGNDAPAVKAGTTERLYTLPNRLTIAHQNKAETDHFYRDIFEHRSYVRHIEALPRESYVFDVGANIGLFSLFIHTEYPGARVYAFEPSPPTYGILKRNLAEHGVNAEAFEVGLSNVEATRDFTFYPHSSGMSSVYGDPSEERAVLSGILRNQLRSDPSALQQVVSGFSEELLEQRLKSQHFTCRLRTLSNVIRELGVDRIDLLKIDVQKSELDVLHGIEAHDWPKIRALVLEVHDIDGRVSISQQLLQGHGYDVLVEQDELYQGTGIFLVYARQRSGIV